MALLYQLLLKSQEKDKGLRREKNAKVLCMLYKCGKIQLQFLCELQIFQNILI